MKNFILTVSALLILPCLTSSAFADRDSVAVRPAPAIMPGTWINGAPTTIADQKGKVVVLLFWTRDCINCKHNLGYWNDWAKKYRNTNVSVLSVHTPETASEWSVAGTRRFVRAWGLSFPVVTDNDQHTWNAFGVQSWPTEILIDKQGRIRAQFSGELNWQGSGEYKTVQSVIEALRAEKN